MIIQFIYKNNFNNFLISSYNELFRKKKMDIKISKKIKNWNNEKFLSYRYVVERDKFIVAYNDILTLINVYLKDTPKGVLQNLINDILKIYYLYKVPNSLILHASGVCINNRAHLFAGVKGSGKSTLISFFNLKDVLNDDRIFLVERENNFYAKGLIFCGKFKSDRDDFIKLGNIFFIFHEKKDLVIPISKNRGYREVLLNSFIPFWDKDIVKRKIFLIDVLVKRIPLFYLFFKPTEEITSYLFNFIKKSEAK